VPTGIPTVAPTSSPITVVDINNFVTFSNVNFTQNEKSVLFHEYGPDGASTVVTFEDCSWRQNEESDNSISALSSLITVRASSDASAVFADDGTAHLVISRNEFVGNERFEDSMINAYFGSSRCRTLCGAATPTRC
jgi:hypothetical protein